MGAKTKLIAQKEPEIHVGDKGAPDTLRWVADQEFAARERYAMAIKALEVAVKKQRERPPELDGEDFDKRVKDCESERLRAFEAWEEWGNMLHKFDKSVEPERRDSSEKLTREQFEKMAALLFISLRETVQKTSLRFCQEVVAMPMPPENPAQVHKLMHGIFCESAQEGIRAAVENQHLPEWCGKLAEGVI